MTFLNDLSKFTPLKKKYPRANHSCFVSKELDEAVMQWSKLRNGYLKDKTRTARKEIFVKNKEMFVPAFSVNLKSVTMKI